MRKYKKASVALFIVAALLIAPLCTNALSGTKTKKIKVDVYTEQGDDWFQSLSRRTTFDGVLKAKDTLPGWYKFKVHDDDEEESGQYLAVKLRLTDVRGAQIEEETDVDLYTRVNDVKTFVNTIETDDEGWIEVSGLSFDTEYKLEIDEDDEAHIGRKDGKARIKVRTKIDDSDWFHSAYDRTDEAMVFEKENVLPGKYKFKYKNNDRAETEPFTLKIRLRYDEGERIKKPEEVELYAYINKQRVLVGEMKTDARGWLTIPGVMTNMKYKIKVDDED